MEKPTCFPKGSPPTEDLHDAAASSDFNAGPSVPAPKAAAAVPSGRPVSAGGAKGPRARDYTRGLVENGGVGAGGGGCFGYCFRMF